MYDWDNVLDELYDLNNALDELYDQDNVLDELYDLDNVLDELYDMDNVLDKLYLSLPKVINLIFADHGASQYISVLSMLRQLLQQRKRIIRSLNTWL